ncbi:MAG: patatin-like phospholipase family protein [Acidobacteriota bacterium]
MSASKSVASSPPCQDAGLDPKVFTAELADLQERRTAAGVEEPCADAEVSTGASLKNWSKGPSTALGLVGLALSGGGIRSASFNLGLLQALHARGILRHVDYLSTVSGGGFVGGALTRWWARRKGYAFPWTRCSGVESKELQHFREHGNYLAPRGFWDQVVMAMVVIRGLLIHSLCFFGPVILAVSFFTAWLARHEHAAYYPLVGVMVAGFWLLLLLFPAFWRGVGRRRMRERFSGVLARLVVVPVIVLFLGVQPILLPWLEQQAVHWSWPAVSTVATGIGSVLGGLGVATRRLVGRIALSLVGVITALFLLLIELHFAHLFYLHEPVREWGALAFVVLFVLSLFVDVNATSGHGFWRERQSEAFLQMGLEEVSLSSGQRRAIDRFALSEIRSTESAAPYHLLNGVVNLQGERSARNSGRQGDFFLFSKLFVGNEALGYRPSSDYSKQVDLGTAMAISSAAASPNMGKFTMSSLTLILAILNVRLGYWLSNPTKMDKRPKTPGLFEFFREAVGLLGTKGRLINVSDGGHLENLGLYQLLKRRCKFIIVGDGEADPQMKFGALADVMRHARIDLGVEIDIDMEDLSLDPATGLSRTHCALGRILYPPQEGGEEEEAEVGWLLYVKASLTGDEGPIIGEYAERDPTFPHQSTADQFFDETQLEAYRALGEHAMGGLWDELGKPGPANDDGEAPLNRRELRRRFRRLRLQLAPGLRTTTPSFVELQRQLTEVEHQLSNPELAAYHHELYPESDISGVGARANPTDQALLTAVNIQLQLMENVFLDLGLGQARVREHESNAGWMNLFRRWSRSRTFRWGYGVSCATYGLNFRRFCEQAFGLRLRFTWHPRTDVDELEKLLGLRQDAVVGALEKGALLLVAELRVGDENAGSLAPLRSVEEPVLVAWACVEDGTEGSRKVYRLDPLHGMRSAFNSLPLYELTLQQLAAHAKQHGYSVSTHGLRDVLLPEYRDRIDLDDLRVRVEE